MRTVSSGVVAGAVLILAGSVVQAGEDFTALDGVSAEPMATAELAAVRGQAGGTFEPNIRVVFDLIDPLVKPFVLSNSQVDLRKSVEAIALELLKHEDLDIVIFPGPGY